MTFLMGVFGTLRRAALTSSAVASAGRLAVVNGGRVPEVKVRVNVPATTLPATTSVTTGAAVDKPVSGRDAYESVGELTMTLSMLPALGHPAAPSDTMIVQGVETPSRKKVIDHV
jgi:hypothetical protein